MKKSRSLLPILAVVAMSGFLLVGCSDGSGGVTTINGVAVPPEPDPIANVATLTGVDSNNNGVRDDVERKIASSNQSQSVLQDTLLIAKQYQYLLASENLSSSEINKIQKTILCASSNTSTALTSNDIKKLILNTDVRVTEFKKRLTNFDGIVFNSNRDCK